MLIKILVSTLFGLIGFSVGKALAARGITANNSLEHHQKSVYLIFTVFVLLTGILLGFGYFKRTDWIPTCILLAVGAYFTDFILALGYATIGLLIGLESSRWNRDQHPYQLLGVIALLTIPLSILFHQSLPITSQLGQPLEVETIVLQTTPYSCSPATIATLARWTGKHPQLTEKDVVKIAGTNRFGTSTWAEIKTMKKLGLVPRYQRQITLNDLILEGKPALLQVNEPIGNLTIPHAVALLEIDQDTRTLMLANPLYGKQLKTFEEMKGYWTGQAILVDLESPSGQF